MASRSLRRRQPRAALYLAADGKCQLCGCQLPPDWHADHVVPFSVSGTTNVHEMQALCPTCNFKKGAKMAGKQLRRHQQQVKKIAARFSEMVFGGHQPEMLCWVVPAGGKSMIPKLLLDELPEHVNVCWLVPRDSLRYQAASDYISEFGIALRDCYEARDFVDPRRGHRGIITTYQAATMNIDLLADDFKRTPYVLILDETHHLKVYRDDTPNSFASAVSRLKWAGLVQMTGTLSTSDNSYIWNVPYEMDLTSGRDKACPLMFDPFFVRYTRSEAREEEAIVPLEFFHHDGPVQWRELGNDEPEEEQILSKVNRENEAKAIYTALNSEAALQLFHSGMEHYIRNATPDGKLIIVCCSQGDARRYLKRAAEIAPDIPGHLGITDNPQSGDAIKAFRSHHGRAVLATCAMAYEGLDVPSVSHLICLTHIRATAWIEQMLARSWRAHPGKTCAYAFVPDDPRFNRTIAAIRDESPGMVLVREGGGGGSPGADPVEPINGHVATIRVSDIEGAERPYQTPEQKELFDCAVANGVSPTDSRLLSLLSDLVVKKTSEPVTVNDREAALRKQVFERCQQASQMRAKRLGKDGYDQELAKHYSSKIWYEFRKGIGSMRVPDLDKAIKRAQQFVDEEHGLANRRSTL